MRSLREGLREPAIVMNMSKSQATVPFPNTARPSGMRGPAKAAQRPLRRCVACNRQAPKGELIRLARPVDGPVAVDPTGKAPGRGAYLCDDPACWERGLTRGRLSAVLKRPLTAEEQTTIRQVLALRPAPAQGDTP